jgi:hypothetical protein
VLSSVQSSAHWPRRNSAVYVETSLKADLYLTSLEHYDQTYRGNDSRALDTWRMGETDKLRYDADPNVSHVRVTFSFTNWMAVRTVG